MPDVALRKGDRLPSLTSQFLIDNVAVDLTGGTVVFNMWASSTGTQVVTNGSVTITDLVNGRVRYDWTAADALLSAGVYVASFTATLTAKELTAPNSGMLVIEIFSEIGAEWNYRQDFTRKIDIVRLLVGDTDSNDQLLSDSEITYFVELHGTANRSASEAARAIAAKFARNMSRSIGGLQADFAAKHRQYLALADSLMSKEESYPVSPFVSGYIKSSKQLREDDTEREEIFGRKGGMDNLRGTTSDDYYHRAY
jgi:hypothetical protein